MVEFSRAMGCYVWECEWGHSGYDCESAWEAEQQLAGHVCRRTA